MVQSQSQYLWAELSLKGPQWYLPLWPFSAFRKKIPKGHVRLYSH